MREQKYQDKYLVFILFSKINKKPISAATIFVDQVNFEQGATFLGRNSNYVYELGTSLEFTKIGGGCSGEVAIESYSPSTGPPVDIDN